MLFKWARANGWKWVEHSDALDAPLGHRTNDGFVIHDEQQALDYMNLHFAYVRKNGIMEIIYDTEFKRLRYDFMTIDQTKELLANVFVEIVFQTDDGEKRVTYPIFGFWFNSTQRRQYTLGLEFHPSAAVIEYSVEHAEWLEEHKCAPSVHVPRVGVLNIWRGFGYEARKKEGQEAFGEGWMKLAEHMFHNLCGGNVLYFTYLIYWAAYMVQFPDRQGEVAVVIRGGKGCGKGIFFRTLVKLFGQHGLQITNPSQLTGKFNRHLGDLVMLFADEAFYAGNKEHESVLKGLITEPEIPVEPKFRDVMNRKSRLHLGMAANADWVVPASKDERRYFVLDALELMIGNSAYFKAIVDELENGGYEAMLYDLQRLPLVGFDVRAVPQTEGLMIQKRHTMKHEERWWAEVLHRGYLTFPDRLGMPVGTYEWPKDGKILNSDLAACYKGFVKEHPQFRSLDERELGKFTKEMSAFKPCLMGKCRLQGKHFGDLATARARFIEVTGITIDWEDDIDEMPEASDESLQRGPDDEDVMF